MEDWWNPEIYEASIPRRIEIAFSIFKDFRYAFSGNEAVLDVACGTGHITAEIAKKIPQGSVIGLDLSETMIRFAQVHFQLPNLSFVQGDAANFSLSRTFNLIVSFAALHWVKAQDSFLHCVNSHLKPGGKFIFLFYPKYLPLWQALDQLMASEKWSAYFKDFHDPFYHYDLDSYKALVKGAGLQLEQIKIESHPFTSQQTFITIVQDWLPHLAQIPEALRVEFLQQVSEITQRILGKDSDTFQVDFPSLRVYGKKPVIPLP